MAWLRQGAMSPTTKTTDRPELMSPMQVRPLGGGVGCLMMILVSVALSVGLTILVNVLGR